jgi:hypothetical protein
MALVAVKASIGVAVIVGVAVAVVSFAAGFEAWAWAGCMSTVDKTKTAIKTIAKISQKLTCPPPDFIWI